MNDTPTTDSPISQSLKERETYREGVKLALPTMPGIFAWGMVSGIAIMKAGLTLWQALGMTFIVFAGSAQLSAVPMMAANVPPSVIFVTSLIVNLRFVIFGAAIGPHFAHLPWYKRIWYGYLNADVTMALFPRRFPFSTRYQPEGKEGFYKGICYTNWWVWQCGSVIGILLGSQIPASWGVGFAGTLALLAIMIPLALNAAAFAGVLVAGAVSVGAYGLPYRLGLLLAVLVGIVVALGVDNMLEKRKALHE